MSDTELAPEVAPVPAESESAEEDVAPGSPVEDVQPAGKPPGPCCGAVPQAPASSIMIVIYPTPMGPFSNPQPCGASCSPLMFTPFSR